MTAAQEFFNGADKLQKTPITGAVIAELVELTQRANLYAESRRDGMKSAAERHGIKLSSLTKAINAIAKDKQQETRDELQGTLDLLGGE